MFDRGEVKQSSMKGAMHWNEFGSWSVSVGLGEGGVTVIRSWGHCDKVMGSLW